MGSIKFNKQNNRLKRKLPGQDHYTGLIFFSATLPAGFDADNRIKIIADIDAAEALGITPDNASIDIKVMHYHLSELFRVNPDAVLWVGIFDEPVGDHTFNEVSTLRIFSQNTVRQIGVFTKKAFATAQLDLLQDMYDEAFAIYAPCEIVLSANLVGVTDDNLPDLAALTDANVHLSVGQDGAAKGAALFTEAATFSVGCIGAMMGAISLAKVNENIGWVEKFDMAVTGGELDVPALANGTLINTLADNIVKDKGTLDTKRLIFLKKYPGVTGTYFNDSHSACVSTSDFAYIEDNRTIDKAIRGIYINLAPKINGPVLLDKNTGKLSPEYVDYLQLEAGKALEDMEKDGELSGYTVTIDADQNVNATGQIVINVSNDKVGVSRNLVVNIGY